jgi:uncharacterized membrane protein YozB (DUF420 family)
VTLHDLPAVNATLNGTAAALLVAAFASIRGRRVHAHAYLMLSAVLTSAAFLTCYLIYHANVPPKSIGLQPGTFRTAYFVLLISHTILAAAVLPMILLSLWRAYRRQWTRHRWIAVPTFWIWFYVSVTGVIIYLVLYHVVPAMYPVAQTSSTGVLP